MRGECDGEKILLIWFPQAERTRDSDTRGGSMMPTLPRISGPWQPRPSRGRTRHAILGARSESVLLNGTRIDLNLVSGTEVQRRHDVV